MPNVITGNYNNVIDSTLLSKDLDYDYPYDLNLRPGSKTHEIIKNAVLRRARESHSLISDRIPSWNRTEKIMTAYIDLSEDEKNLQDTDGRKPVSIVFPYSYVIIETVLTYLIMAFLQDPILRYGGVSSEDTIGAIMLESTIQHQCNKFKVALALHTFLRDSLVYGIGIGAPIWQKVTGMVIREDTSSFMSFFKGRGKRSYTEEVVYEGNKLENVDPYLYLPDPRVPSHKIQEGEYVGWIDLTSRISLLREEKISDDIFNAKYLKGINLKRSSIFNEGETKRGQKSGVNSYTTKDQSVNNPVDVIYMYVDLIPKEWELGTGEYPEKWLFGLANDDIVIKAKKLGLAHGMYPLITAAPDFDGYSILPLARSEILYGMQNVLDFLFNSHVANVRKAINDMLIVDPYLVNISDLKDPNPGKLIRLRRPAWGKGVKDSVQQLAVNDITRNNIADSGFIMQWMRTVGAADESMMGGLRQGGPERLTGQEFQGTRAGAISRLERVAKTISLQALQDLGYMFASHTQQLMSKEIYSKISGRHQRDLMEVFGEVTEMKITPWDLLIDYDVEVKDGSIPGGSGAQSWARLYETLAKNPDLASKFDMVRIFEHIATEMGAKNVKDFRVNPKILSDDQIGRELQKGNILPMQEGGQGVGV